MAYVKDDARHKRLREAVDWSRGKLDNTCKNRLDFLRALVGKHYSAAGSDTKKPVHMLAMGVAIHLFELAAQLPKVLATTPVRALKPCGAEMGLVVTRALKRMRFGGTQRGVVTDAMFGPGILKMGISALDGADAGDVRRREGELFADRVSLDNWVIDVGADEVPRAEYMGDRYSVPYEPLMESGFVPAGKRDLVKATEPGALARPQEGANDLSSGKGETPKEIRDRVTLWDVWVPGDGVVVTMTGDPNGPVIREAEWEGVEEGPYRLLGFGDVPDNVMPLAPAALWYDLDDLTDRLWNKLGRQAERQKTVPVAQRRHVKDAKKVVDAGDGVTIAVDGEPAKALREFRYGGPDNVTLGMFLQAKNLASWVMGNLDTLGGLSPLADTLGQEEMLGAGAAKSTQDKARRVMQFLEGVCRDVAWYEWHNPMLDARVFKPVAGTKIELPVRFTPESRKGDFIDYNFTIVPHSTQYISPAKRLAIITDYLRKIVLPLYPFFQAQGASLELQKLNAMYAEYSQTAEIEDLVQFAGGGQGPDRRDAVRKPPITTREQIRTSRPGAARPAQDGALAQMLAAGPGRPGVQPAVAAGVTRGAS